MNANEEPTEHRDFQLPARPWKTVFPVLGFFLLALNWFSNKVSPGKLMLEVEPVFRVNWLETKWLYAILLAFTLFCPLVFGLLPQLKFYKKWPRFFKANLPVAAVFIAWDAWFAEIGVWGFSEKYTTGFRLLGLPWEEWAFFVVVPAACVFIFDSLGLVLNTETWSKLLDNFQHGDSQRNGGFKFLIINKLRPLFPLATMFKKAEKWLTLGLAFFFLLLAESSWENIYTATTAIGCAYLLCWHFFFGKGDWRGRFYVSYLVSCLFFLIINGVLTGAFTQSPVVVYNPEEYFGVRIGTIPVDDFAYSFLMLFANVWLFEEMPNC